MAREQAISLRTEIAVQRLKAVLDHHGLTTRGDELS